MAWTSQLKHHLCSVFAAFPGLSPTPSFLPPLTPLPPTSGPPSLAYGLERWGPLVPTHYDLASLHAATLPPRITPYMSALSYPPYSLPPALPSVMSAPCHTMPMVSACSTATFSEAALLAGMPLRSMAHMPMTSLPLPVQQTSPLDMTALPTDATTISDCKRLAGLTALRSRDKDPGLSALPFQQS